MTIREFIRDVWEGQPTQAPDIVPDTPLVMHRPEPDERDYDWGRVQWMHDPPVRRGRIVKKKERETCGECVNCIPCGMMKRDGIPRRINTCELYDPIEHRARSYWVTDAARPDHCPYYRQMTTEERIREFLEPMSGVSYEVLRLHTLL